MKAMEQIFQDTFLFSCLLGDQYNKETVEFFDRCMMEGPYGYTEGGLERGKVFDVTVKENDVVIDAGAWIGDFGAYAASKGALAYCFEPVHGNFALLQKTAELNGGNIIPVQKGLGKGESQFEIYINTKDSSGSSMYFTRSKVKETVSITSLDKFVKENRLNKIDFIKSDIEGAERDLLKGAQDVLKHFAPKLAICTYHSPEDPAVLENIIMETNPKYRIHHTRQKLFARVME